MYYWYMYVIGSSIAWPRPKAHSQPLVMHAVKWKALIDAKMGFPQNLRPIRV